ncbi:hypothetical protein ACH4D5_14155 [Streptomyces sp. NPDC018029]
MTNVVLRSLTRPTTATHPQGTFHLYPAEAQMEERLVSRGTLVDAESSLV